MSARGIETIVRVQVITPHIVKVREFSYTPRHDPPSPNKIKSRLDGPHSWSGRFGDEKNPFPLLKVKPRFRLSLRVSQVYN